MVLPHAQAPGEVFLHPGDHFFGRAPSRVRTLLGSCVTVTVWHPGWRVGGMCHALLPSRVRPPGDALDGRYVDEAVEMLAAALRVHGVQPGACRAKLFGGGNMFNPPASDLDVGRRNVDAARRCLAMWGFVVVREDVGGDRPRRLSFDLASGRVWQALTDRAGI
ncbi:chemoreceptor glutamine deamidase CheD [Hydrogenophaga aquatica]